MLPMNVRHHLKAFGPARLMFFGFTILAATLASSLAFAQAPSVALFPFSIQAEQPNPKIRESILEMLKDRLEKDGAKIVIVKDVADLNQVDQWDYYKFREEGVRLGVDRIITGHIFMAGKGVSLDTSMHNVFENEPPLTFFSQAEGIGGLGSAVNRLGRSITGELFEKSVIALFTVKGNKRVESDAILRVVTSQKGDIADSEKLSHDLEQIYKMGYFDDVTVKKNKLDRGLEIIFEVDEKPSVRKIIFTENIIYEEEELFEVVETRTGSILNLYKINSDVERLKQLYTDKNYHNCVIAYEVKPLDNNQADIVFTIEEGKKLKVESITFEGNRFFDEDDLKDEIQTSEKGFWSFITSSGDLNETEAQNDALRLESFYKNNGFINAKVSDPQIQFGHESISIHFKIKEGEQYKVGTVAITGDILTTREELMAGMESREGELYNRELVRKDMITLSDMYSDKGYANVDVVPLMDRDDEKHVVNLSFKIDKKDLVYFNRIVITGNSKSRDKVIRRELAIEEQGLYSKRGLQRSYRNLNYKDYFQNIEVTPVPTDRPNYRDVDVKVEEKATGNISFGGGFSSDDGAFAQVSLEERNFLGRGYNLKLLTRLSGSSLLYKIGFTEPWLFDRPISVGADIYKLEKEYDYYDRDSVGFTLRSGYRALWDYTTVGVEYNLEQFDISDVESDYTNVREGSWITSSIKPYIKYDSRNHYFLPTKGAFHKFSIEYAGEFVGGEVDFTRYLVETGYWIPLFWKFVGAFHAEGGYLDDRTGSDIDIDWERFYLGGINSIRGFDDTDINCTPEGETIQRGGEQYVMFNFELIFPIQEEMGVIGVLFYDRGDVYRKSDSIDLAEQYSTVGFEFRWNSPMGPIRLAYGIVVEGQDVKDTGEGQFDFSVGAFF